MDLGISSAGSWVEHYETAGYTTAINLAKQLGNTKVVSLLSETLNEEEAADEKLRKIGQQLLKQAPVNKDARENPKKMSAIAVHLSRCVARRRRSSQLRSSDAR